MRVVRNDLWLCVDCTAYACNGETSGIDDPEREREVTDGVNALGPHLVADWDDCEEREDVHSGYDCGHLEFSRRGCDACGSCLAGELHRFAVLAPDTLRAS